MREGCSDGGYGRRIGVTAAPTEGTARLDRLVELLGGEDAINSDFYAILDCARDRRIHPFIHRQALDFTCLFRGPLPPVLERCAPYLVHLYPRQRWTRQLIELAWGNSWGIFLRSTAPMETLRLHFRRFLHVKDASGRRLLFRYYDPRVGRVYLPTCTPSELKFVFGPVSAFLMESPSGEECLRFAYERDGLSADPLPID